MGYFDLDSNMIVQVGAFVLTLLCWGTWVVGYSFADERSGQVFASRSHCANQHAIFFLQALQRKVGSSLQSIQTLGQEAKLAFWG